MPRDINNSEDIMDSRDVIERIADLEADLETARETPIEDPESFETREAEWLETSEEGRELVTLRALAEEASQYAPDWRHGETLIRDSYFRNYAEELARDTCEMGKAQDWPFRHIDWDAAADELKNDYTEIDFDGVAYWIRS